MYSRAFVALSLLSVYVYCNGIPGGFQNRNVTDHDVVNAAAFAVGEYNQKSNDQNYYKLIRIVSAKSQVVAGTRYVLDVKIGRTNCKRTSTIATPYCNIIKNPPLAKTLLCTFQVLTVPWLNEETLESFSCTEQH